MFEALFNAVVAKLTLFMTMPTLTTFLQIVVAAPSNIQLHFPTQQIAASIGQPYHEYQRPLFENVPWKGEEISALQFLALTKSQAFIAIHKGKLVHEWYAAGVDETTNLPSFSVAKSIVSLLAGQAIERGVLDEDATLVSVLPELKSGTDYDFITIRHLLDMQSGVDVPEEYYSPRGTLLMTLTNDLGYFVKTHQDLKFQPGAQSDYRSVDTQLLGMAVARAEGRSLSSLLTDNIWQPMGAQDDATWNLDKDGGQEKAFCCINATARDFAKIGSLVLNDGVMNDQRIISHAWIERLKIPVGTTKDLGYGAQFWHFGDGDFGAIGIFGQYIYIDKAREIVLVKLSNYGAEQDEAETIDAFRAISRALSVRLR